MQRWVFGAVIAVGCGGEPPAPVPEPAPAPVLVAPTPPPPKPAPAPEVEPIRAPFATGACPTDGPRVGIHRLWPDGHPTWFLAWAAGATGPEGGRVVWWGDLNDDGRQDLILEHGACDGAGDCAVGAYAACENTGFVPVLDPTPAAALADVPVDAGAPWRQIVLTIADGSRGVWAMPQATSGEPAVYARLEDVDGASGSPFSCDQAPCVVEVGGVPFVREAGTWAGTATVPGLVPSPAGAQVLVLGSPATMRDATTGKELFKAAFGATAAAWSADGKVLLAGTDDGDVHGVDPSTGAAQWTTHAHEGRVVGVAASADGKRYVTVGADGRVAAWKVGSTSAQASRALGDASGGSGFTPTSVGYAADRVVVGSVQGTVASWSLLDDTVVFATDASDAVARDITWVAPQPGNRAASLDDAARLRVWGASGGLVATQGGGAEFARAVAWSADHGMLAYVDKDQELAIADVVLPAPDTESDPRRLDLGGDLRASRVILRRVLPHGASAAAFLPDGRLLVALDSGSIAVLDAKH